MQKQPFCQMNTFQNAFKNEYKVKQVSKIEQMLFAQSIKWIISAEQYIFETIQQLKKTEQCDFMSCFKCICFLEIQVNFNQIKDILFSKTQ